MGEKGAGAKSAGARAMAARGEEWTVQAARWMREATAQATRATEGQWAAIETADLTMTAAIRTEEVEAIVMVYLRATARVAEEAARAWAAESHPGKA